MHSGAGIFVATYDFYYRGKEEEKLDIAVAHVTL